MFELPTIDFDMNWGQVIGLTILSTVAGFAAIHFIDLYFDTGRSTGADTFFMIMGGSFMLWFLVAFIQQVEQGERNTK